MTDQKTPSFFASVQTRAAAAGKSVREMPTRRKLLLGGSTVVAVGAVTALSMGRQGGGNGMELAVRRTPKDRIEDLGDGFYMVDGWVLTEGDLARIER